MFVTLRGRVRRIIRMWKVLKYVGDENRVVEICGKIESEISLLETMMKKSSWRRYELKSQVFIL